MALLMMPSFMRKLSQAWPQGARRWPASLTAKELAQHVQIRGNHKDREDKYQPHDGRHPLDLFRGGFAPQLLVDQEDHVSAIEDGNGQEIDHGQVDTDDPKEQHKGDDIDPRDLVSTSDDADRP